ncbi:hypothetical protein ABW19_dt0204933 [Dactylella cylindrospora]|nr:hypothetical protein ABW19_dt0204933 [Dactylella cylindrospora]
MAGDNFKVRPWPIFLLSFVGFSLFIFNVVILSGVDVKGKITKKLIPTKNPFPYFQPPDEIDDANELPFDIDQHPIVELTRDQLRKFDNHVRGQSKNFAHVVQKYRRKYGRHPPPKFDEARSQVWYKFAKKRNCPNLDDFDQIMDDLRPFWGIPPAEIRAMVRAMDSEESKVVILRIRDHKVAEPRRPEPLRTPVFTRMLQVVAPYLPDMDIAMNFLDEPRVIATWDEVQAKLSIEKKNRTMPAETPNEFSKISWDTENLDKLKLDFVGYGGKMYMDLAAKACPPESYARRPEIDVKQVENTYKDPIGGFIRNFNRSSDLCTVGPTLSQIHGFLFSSSTVIASLKLIPIFNECKVNVNNDILFPANKYYDETDDRYAYDPSTDIEWFEKKDVAIWRGATTDGAQVADSYHRLHRHRFVALTNSTALGSDTKVTIMAAVDEDNTSGEYAQVYFHPWHYAEMATDIAFHEIWGCVPDCNFLKDKLSTRPGLDFKETWKFKYLPDIDGRSFSGRWYAFLKSKSMGLKATIFREWHDQRLFEWVHFVPMDNRFDDLYALLTYYTGLEKGAEGSDGAYVPRHDTEAKRIADRSREWAEKVLRKEDIEVYMLRLLLEYARVVDDNRDNIGYSGDGTEVDAAEKNKWGWGR